MKLTFPGLLLTSLILLLSSCCTTEKFEQRLDTYLNRPKVDIIQDFGEPVRTEKFGDIELVTFLRDRSYLNQGTAPSIQHYKKRRKDGSFEEETYLDPGTPAYIQHKTCEFTFRLQKGKVVSWSHNGNDCCDE